jgi:hypothetical protein
MRCYPRADRRPVSVCVCIAELASDPPQRYRRRSTVAFNAMTVDIVVSDNLGCRNFALGSGPSGTNDTTEEHRYLT